MTDTDTPVRGFLESLGPMTDIGQWPTKKELEKFIEVFDRLDNFEGEQRQIRGYGIFNDEPLPIPEVMVVSRWLSSLVKSM